MHRETSGVLIAIAVGVLSPTLLHAQSAAAQRINACSLLPKEEVKKHLPWNAMFDKTAVEEEAIGTTGSSCEYPSVGIQVLPSSSRIIEIAREKGGLEKVSGIGSEAYFHSNPNGYAELYVRTSRHILTIQASADGGVSKVKPGVLSLAKALVSKL